MSEKKSKEIYLLYECDEWKTRRGMVLLMATTSKTKLHAKIRKELLLQKMGFNKEVGEDAVAAFTDRSSEYAYDYTYLVKGYVETVNDGEEIE